MKKHIKYLLPVILVILVTGCTKRFDKINSNPGAITEAGKQELPFMFSAAESWACINRSYYQTVQNLYADFYAQYFAQSTNDFTTDRYVMHDGWLPRMGIITYVNVVPQLQAIFENTDSTSGQYALADIMWVYAFDHMTDYFGPIQYFDAGKAQSTIPYDAQDKIYADFFKRLDQAVANLQKLGSGANVFGSYDLIYGGSVSKWILFANTLRLRLALRVSGVDPQLAKTEAEAAVASGVMTDVSQSAWIKKSLSGNDGNGLSQVSAYNAFSMSSTMYSYLKGYNDPRLGIYFQPAQSTGTFSSVRNGSSTLALNNPLNSPAQTSNVGTYWVTWNGSSWVPQLTAAKPVIYAAEAYFLRAEGALNGWNMGGSAQSLYEMGIQTSMEQWGITDQTVINNYINSTSLPAAPGDVANSAPVAAIPVKWAASEDEERQQIGTQKWLAIYPDAMEAWAEFRRTGYPKMYPVLESDNPDLPQGTFIQRLTYPSLEYSTDLQEVQQGVQLLGGPDKVSTPLWWAKK
jgi:hypothetical protein